MRNGDGVFTVADGSLIYSGQWRNDERFGVGKLTNGDEVYEGEFKKDVRSGIGKNSVNNKVIFEGLWEDDERINP